MNDVKNKIIDRFLDAQNRLVIQSSDLSLESIANMVSSDAIDIAPHYQRRERWSIERQSALIESFLLNIPVPPIYLAEDEYGKYSVIDGKQRITAIHKFIKENLKLQELQDYKDLEGYTFDQLPEILRNALTIRPYIRVVTILKQSDENLKYEVFTRLNTGGENLLPQEIRNVAYRGSMNDLIFKLAENKFLKKQLKITSNSSKAYKEMLDAEYILRFFTLRNDWKSFSGNMKDAMDEYMRKNQNPGPNKISTYKRLFEETIFIVEKIWGKYAFMRPDGNTYRNQLLQGVYDVEMVAVSLFLPQNKNLLIQNAEKIRNTFKKVYNENIDFENSIRQFTSNPERVKLRIQTMEDLISKAIK